jgi:magnesium transporter
MARFIRKSKSEIGESPFELRYRGKQKEEPVLMRVIDYSKQALKEATLKKFLKIKDYKTTDTVTWLNVDGLHDQDVVEQIGEVFSLDRMILSDVMNVGSRPKIQEYEECLFASIKMIQLGEESKEITVENLSLVIADRLMISFQEKRGDVFEPVRERIRKKKPKIISSGTDYLAFALLDVVIDNYIYILSILGDKIETLEDMLLDEPARDMLEQISDLKREISFMRRNSELALSYQIVIVGFSITTTYWLVVFCIIIDDLAVFRNRFIAFLGATRNKKESSKHYKYQSKHHLQLIASSVRH